MVARAIASYWDGDSWEDVVTNSTSAVLSFKITDHLGKPQQAKLLIANASTTPFSGASGQSDGPFTGIFTDFMPIRIKDGDTSQVYFYGAIYKTLERYDKQNGMVLELTAIDWLNELKENNTADDFSYTILSHATDASINPADMILYSQTNTPEYDMTKKVWTDAIASRGGLIKSLIDKGTNNVTHPGSGASTDARFADSLEKYQEDFIYNLGGKSYLQHIASLASDEPHDLEANEQIYGFSYYADPNFTATGNTKPTAFFNYFKRASRPSTNPSTYGLKLEHPSGANFSQTGQLHAMNNFSFERPREDTVTEAVVTFHDTGESSDDGPGIAEGTTVTFEALKIKAANTSHSAVDGSGTGTSPNFTWKGKAITGGTAGSHSSEMLMAYSTLINGAITSTGASTFVVDSITDLHKGQTIVVSHSGSDPEEMKITAINTSNNTLTVTRNTDGTGAHTHSDDAFVYVADVARMQYINKTSGITNTDPGYVLVSEIDPVLTEGNQTGIFAENKIFVGRTSGTTFTLKSRPKATYGVSKSVRESVGDLKSQRAVREKIAAKLIRKSAQKVVGSFTSLEKPRFYVDFTPSAISTSGGVDTATISGTLSALDGAVSSTTATTFTVDSDATTAFTVGEIVNIDSEMVRITEITNSTTIEVERGVGSTTAATHSDNATISGASPFSYGIRIGTTLVELDSSSNITTTYGYVSAMSGTTINTTLSTGTMSTSKAYRFYVPVRAGDLVKVRNDLVNVNTNMIVTATEFVEESGVQKTRYEVVGSESAITDGDNAKMDFEGVEPESSGIAALIQSASTDNQMPETHYPQEKAKDYKDAFTTCVFTSQTGDLLDSVAWTAGTLTIGNTKTSIDAGETGDMNSDGRKYNIYYSGSGSTLSTVEKSAYAALADVKNGFAVLIAEAKYGDPESIFKLFVQQTDIPTKGDATKFISNQSMTTALLKKGAQPWTTTVEFQKFPQSDSSLYNKFSWGNGTAGNTAGYISFGTSSSDTHPVDSGNSNTDFSSIGGANLSSGLSDNTTYYCFLDISDSSSAYPVGVTTDYRVPYQDNKILMATVIVGTSQDNTNTKGNSPTILPFNGVVPTISANAIAANSITADVIQANAITADTITANAITSKHTITGSTIRTASITRSGSGGGGSVSLSGAGVLLDSTGIYGASAAGTGNLHFEMVAAGTFAGMVRLGNGLIVIKDNGIHMLTNTFDGSLADDASGLIRWYGTHSTNTSRQNYDAESPSVVIGQVADTEFLTATVTGIDIKFKAGPDTLLKLEGSDTGTYGLMETNSPLRVGYTGIGLEGTVTVTQDYAYGAQVTLNSSLAITASTPMFGSTAIQLVSSSAKKYKDNIKNMKVATEKLYDLNPVSFDWSEKSDFKGKSFGYIAEEVEKLFPELVRYDPEKNTPDSLDYHKLSVLLVEEIKNLHNRIKELEKK